MQPAGIAQPLEQQQNWFKILKGFKFENKLIWISRLNLQR
jgi:hypothetical protein